MFIAHLALGIVMVYATQIFTDVVAMGGYRAYLEERVNALTHKNVLSWELRVAPDRRNQRLSPDLLSIFFVLLFIGLLIHLNLGSPGRTLPVVYRIVHFLFSVLLAGILWVARTELRSAHQDAFVAASQSWREGPPHLDDFENPVLEPRDEPGALRWLRKRMRRIERSTRR